MRVADHGGWQLPITLYKVKNTLQPEGVTFRA